ncbi:lysine-specific demethylase JMJ25 [Quillaja saponaria]|uniref:Lysine-specific demethylase JMJ25 n=1 Tax=Quillaja saponaria TaxID=32244 RepID=A0AAD7PD92_QUISA|nr:lysine-specific demethylase JMJ25 [Quillaja saponaria]
MDAPSDVRCKRTAGPKWRCSETASLGKSYCENHLLQSKNQSRKRIERDRDKRSGDDRRRDRGGSGGGENSKKRRRDKVSDGSDGELFESDLNLNPVKKQKFRFSRCKRETVSNGVDEHVTNSHVSISKLNDGKANSDGGKCDSGGGKSNSGGRQRNNSSFSERTSVDGGKCNKIKEKGSLMCHQCQRNDKGGVVFCLNCNRKRYCYECLEKWYPEKTRKEVENACPFCCGNCNCKACLREVPEVKCEPKKVDLDVKLQQLLFLLYKALPVLRHIHKELSSELEIESNIRGIQLQEIDITRAKLDKSERLYCTVRTSRVSWNRFSFHLEAGLQVTLVKNTTYENPTCDNCNTSIVAFYRSCPNPGCSYDLCLTCCQELRKGCQPGGREAETSQKQFVERAHDSTRENSATAKRKRHGSESQQVPTGSDFKADKLSLFPEWRVSNDGNIPCPPKDRGGCGTEFMELQRMFKANWVVKLLKNAEDLTGDYRLPDLDFSQRCSLCHINSDEGISSEVREAAFRDDNRDNFLYTPNAVYMSEDEIEHFQRHWMRGEPVIVRNVLDKTSGLSWEPMVIWRAFRETGSRVKFKEETRSVKAIDCLDWCEVEINIHQFFKGYLEGRMHRGGWPEMLKLKDWPSSTLFEERLPRHCAEFFRALPYSDYTDPKSGVLNFASKLPEDFPETRFGT